jgi:hypothetical protein
MIESTYWQIERRCGMIVASCSKNLIRKVYVFGISYQKQLFYAIAPFVIDIKP